MELGIQMYQQDSDSTVLCYKKEERIYVYHHSYSFAFLGDAAAMLRFYSVHITMTQNLVTCVMHRVWYTLRLPHDT